MFLLKMDKKTCFGAMDELKPMLMMVLSQLVSGGVNIFYKFAVADGMKIRILVVYRLIFATIFTAPIALFFERYFFFFSKKKVRYFFQLMSLL